MDRIRVTGIRCYGYTGFLPEEQILGQWFEVDLTIWVNLETAGESDRIEDTLDYRRAIELVKDRIGKNKYALVEKLATAIADDILQIEKVKRVRVKLSKPAAPIPDFGGKITIDIIRSMKSSDVF
jgi:7,8-dihydroneopterin aldolase/epimerase/oxygenase